jgi:hypothetical protein
VRGIIFEAIEREAVRGGAEDFRVAGRHAVAIEKSHQVDTYVFLVEANRGDESLDPLVTQAIARREG